MYICGKQMTAMVVSNRFTETE